MWSPQGVVLWGEWDKVAVSPDGTYALKPDWALYDRWQKSGLPALFNLEGPNGFRMAVPTRDAVASEALWSDDSRSLALTYSEGGANGQYRLVLLEHGHTGWAIRDPTPFFEKAYRQPGPCSQPEVPNVGAVSWLDGNRLLVAAQTINHSICTGMGTFRLYEYDVDTGHIVAEYDQLEGKRLHRSRLSAYLLSADDEWYRRVISGEIDMLDLQGAG